MMCLLHLISHKPFSACDVSNIFMYILSMSVTSGCDAIANDGSCCTSTNPCAMGEGDCDSDSDCAYGLECGTDNCQYFDSAWPSTSDCCAKGNKIMHLKVCKAREKLRCLNKCFVIRLSQVVMPPGVIGVVAPPPTNVDWAKETVTMMITVLVIGYVEVQATVEILILVGLILHIAAVKNKNLVKINPPK